MDELSETKTENEMAEIWNRIEKVLKQTQGRISYEEIVSRDGSGRFDVISARLAVNARRQGQTETPDPLATVCYEFNVRGDRINAQVRKATVPQIRYTPAAQANRGKPTVKRTGKTERERKSGKLAAREQRLAERRMQDAALSKSMGTGTKKK